MGKCILHIGWSKTGTTSVQEFLFQNQELLRKFGFWYPTGADAPYFWYRSHFPLASSLYPQHFAITPIAQRLPADEMLARLKRDVESAPDVAIISDEHLPYCPSDSVKKLAKVLSRVETKVLCYIRRQDEWHLSAYSTDVLAGGQTRPFDTDYVARNRVQFWKTIKAWGNAFGPGNIAIRLLHRRCLVGGDVVRDFLAHLGVEASDEFRFPTEQNVSMSYSEIEILRACNEYLQARWNDPEAGEQFRLCARVRKHLLKHIEKQGRLQDLLTDELSRQIMSVYRQENVELAEQYLDEDAAAVLLAEMPDRGRQPLPVIGIGSFARCLVDMAVAHVRGVDRQ